MLSKYFDPNKSFLSLKIFWIVIAIHLIFALAMSYIIHKNTNLKIDLSADGFNFFISAFKFPLGILAFTIPNVAFLASNHRSEQTREQINLSNKQNTFQNYYKHIEEYTKYNQALSNKTFKHSRHLHKILFPKAAIGDYHLDDELFFEVEIKLKNILNVILNSYSDSINEDNRAIWSGQKHELTKLIKHFGVSSDNLLILEHSLRKELFYSYENLVINFYIHNALTILIMKEFIYFLIEQATFDTNYIPSSFLDKIASINSKHFSDKIHNPNHQLLMDIKKLLE